MLRFAKLALLGLPLGTLWTVLVVVAVLEGWLREPLAAPGDVEAFSEAAVAMLDEGNRGNVAFRLIGGGERVRDHYLSIGESSGETVNEDTLFQVASLSKWVSAWGVMTLVETGQLSLDAPVSTYLRRWQLPAGEFDNDGVTVRRLLSHTAGLVDGLGYGGFEPGVAVQSLEDSLTQAADASPGAAGRTLVGMAPGSQWVYSGGGYTLLQLLIEEVSGQPFADYMRDRVLAPLGMRRSTFVPDLTSTDNVAVFYDSDGTPAIHYRFTALAAASLYTSVADLSRFLLAHLPGPAGEAPGRGVLAEDTLRAMRVPHGRQLGADIWGLGVMLYAPNPDGGYVIGHDGNNAPAINTAARVNPSTGDAIVVLETGSPLLATQLGGEWVFWQTGTPDVLDVVAWGAATIQTWVLAGWIVVALAVVLLWWRGRTAVTAR